MQRLNITKGHAFMLVFSVTSKQSLEELIAIYREILEVKANEMDNLPIILVGNKCDEENVREVIADYSNEMVSKIFKGCGYIETSAKTGHNVHEAFQVSVTPCISDSPDCFLLPSSPRFILHSEEIF